MRRLQGATAIIALAAAGVLLAGCNDKGANSQGGASAPTGNNSSASSSDSGADSGSAATPKQEALLAASDLPSGMKVQPVDVKDTMKQASSMGQGMKYEPADCGNLQNTAFGDVTKLDGVAMRAVSGGGDPMSGGAVVEMIFKKTSDVSLDKAHAALKKCGNATVSMGQMKATSSSEEVQLSGVKADEAFAFKSTVKMSGMPSSAAAKGMQTQVAVMVHEGLVVEVAVMGNPSGTTLEQLAKKALEKAQKS